MHSSRRTDESFLADQHAQDWAAIMVRASVVSPIGIDQLLESANGLARKQHGSAVFPSLGAMPVTRVVKTNDRAAIGVLLDDQTQRVNDKQAHLMATRYAALAIEKECEVVIFSHQNNAGFERFGFRVERIAGKTDADRANCIEQLRRFWGIEILI